MGIKHNIIQVEPIVEKDALALLKTRVLISELLEKDGRALI